MRNAKFSSAMRRMECFGNTQRITCRLSAHGRHCSDGCVTLALGERACRDRLREPFGYAGDRRYCSAASVKDQIQNDEDDERHTEHPTDQIRHFDSPLCDCRSAIALHESSACRRSRKART
jgi:hypothetical protein